MKIPSPGLYESVAYDEYAAWPATRSSELKPFSKTAEHAHYALTHPKESDALRLGQATHVAVLEPPRFKEQYAVAPRIDRRTKAGKEAWEAFQQDNERRIILTADEYEQAAAMQKAAWRHPLGSTLLAAEGLREVSLLWEDKDTKKPCKARLDLLCNWNGIATIVDIKTTRDASPRSFARDAVNYGYHVSAAWYIDGAHTLLPIARRYVILAIESAPPHVCAVYWMEEEFLDAGRKTGRDWYRRKLLAEETGHWPGYVEEMCLVAPPWTENLDDGGW